MTSRGLVFRNVNLPADQFGRNAEVSARARHDLSCPQRTRRERHLLPCKSAGRRSEMRGLRPRHLAVLAEPLDRLGLIRRTIPVTTNATPMINIGTASVSHPGG